MITFLDENDVEYGALATIKATNAVNGERSLTGTVVSGDYVLANIERGWRLRFDDEYYVVTYAKPVDEGRNVQVTFDAVHQFFWDFDKSSVYDQLTDGSHTFVAYLDFIFKNSGYSYTVDSALNVYAFEKQSFGLKKRLTLFNDIITSTGVEFQVNGKVVRILEKVGTDLSTVVRKNFNMNELTIEKNIGDFVTYQKGYGAYFDEEDHSKGRLEVEYTSTLASVYGKLEAEPLVDERYTQSSSLLAALKANVDNSYTISVSLDMEDLTRAGYKYTQPIAGDYIMAINETLDFQEKIRIVSFTSEYDVQGILVKHEVTCNDIGTAKKLTASYNLTKKQASSASATASNAYSIANKALVSADGKNTNYYGNSFPQDTPKGTLKTGDLLFLTVGDTVKQYYWNGADWIINPVVSDVEAFKEQIAEELKDVPDREEFEATIAQELATSKAELETQIDTAKTQAESNAKAYADEINRATAEVAEQANTTANSLKSDLSKVKADLTATTTTANAAKTSASEAKQQLTTVANDLSKAKTDLQNAVSAVDTKATNLQSDVSNLNTSLSNTAKALQTQGTTLANQAKELQTQASQLTEQAKAQETLTTRVEKVETTANGTKTTVSELSKTVTQNGKDITSVSNRTKTVETSLTSAKTSISELQTSVSTAQTDLTNLTKRTKTVEDGLTGTKTNLSELTQTVSNDGKTIASLTSRTKTVEDSVSGLKTTMSSVQKDLTAVTTRTKTVEDDLSGTKTMLSQVKTTADSTSQKTATLETGLNGIKADLAATTATADTTKTNLANYQASNDKAVANLQSNIQTANGNISSLQTKVEAVPGQITSAVSAVEGKIPTNVSTRNLILKSNDFTNPHKQSGANTTVTSTDDYFVVKSTGYTANAWGGMSWNMSISEVKAGEEFSILMPVYIDSSIVLDSDVYFQLKNHPKNLIAYSYLIPKTQKDKWFNVAITFKTTKDVVLDTYPFYVFLAKNGLVRIKPPMLVRGNLIPSDYQPAFEDTESDITKLNTTLTQTANGLEQLSTQVTSQGNTITSHTNSINSLTTGLSAKVSQTDFNTLSGRVTTAENNLTATANQLSSQITSVEGKIPTEIGSSNLLRKTAVNTENLKFFGKTDTTVGVVTKDGHQAYKLVISGSSNAGAYFTGNDDYYNLIKDRYYTFSFWVLTNKDKTYSSGSLGHIQAVNNNSDKVGNDKAHQHTTPVYSTNTVKANTWTKVWCTFKATSNSYFRPYFWYLTAGDEIYIYDMMLNEGKIPLSYTPAIEDTESDITKLNTTLTQTANGLEQLSTQVTSQENTITSHTNSINSLSTGLSAKVSQTDFNTLSGRVTTAENNITAKANELSSKISSLNVGNKNYLPTSRVINRGCTNFSYSETSKSWTMTVPASSTTFGNGITFNTSGLNILLNGSETLFFGLMIKASKACSFNYDINNALSGSASNDNDDRGKQAWSPSNKSIPANVWTRVWFSYTAKANVPITEANSNFGIVNNTEAITVEIKEVMVAKSNVPVDYQTPDADFEAKDTEFKQTADSIKASVSALDKSTVKSASLTINTDGIVMKAGKSTTDVANAIGAYFAVNQNAINLFSDKINVKANMIVDGAITSTKIDVKSINTAHLNGKIITADVIATGAITADAIKAGAITTDKMTANSINGDRIAAGTLDAAKIKAGSITASRIASGTITSSQIKAGGISATNIATGAVTTDKIAANSINSDKIVSNGLTADVIKGGTLTATNNAMQISLTAGKLEFYTSAAAMRRVLTNYPNQFIKFDTGKYDSIDCGVTVIGSNRNGTSEDTNNGDFAGVRIWNGYKSSKTMDHIDLVGDTIRLVGSAYDSGKGWEFYNWNNNGSPLLKLYGANADQRAGSYIEAGDIHIMRSDGTYMSLKSILNTFNGNFSANGGSYYPNGI